MAARLNQRPQIDRQIRSFASQGKKLALDYFKSAVLVGGQFGSIADTGSK